MHIPRHSRRSFTLLELIVVIAVLAIIIAVVIVSIDPVKRLNASRNNRRRSDVSAIAQAAGVRIADQLPMTDITTDWRIIGTGPAGSCALPCSMIFDALHFGGNGAKVDAGDIDSLDFDGTQSFSISLWIKADSYVTGESHDIITKVVNQDKGYRLAIGDGYVSFIIMDEPVYGRYVRSVLLGEPIVEAGGGYYHVVMAFNHANPSDPIRFFLNGVQANVLPDGGTLLPGNSLGSNAASFVIGGRNNPPIPPSFQGSIDDVRVYQGALNQGSVDTLFDKQNPPDTLLAHWDFEEGIGSSIDEPMALPATLIGTTWTQGISSLTDTVCADLEEELVEGRYLPILPVNVGIPGVVPNQEWTYYAIRRDGAAVEVKSCVSDGEGAGGSEPYPDITASR